MSQLEEKLNSILSDPKAMQQIMSLAQSLGQGEPPKQEDGKGEGLPPMPAIDPKLLQNLAGLSQTGGMDPNQQALLRALSPYVSRDRMGKLERAMRAARLAGAASAFLNSGGLQMLTGR